MPIDLRFSLPAAAVATVIGAVVVVRAAVAPTPPLRRHATPQERPEIANQIATQEREWTRQTNENFPQDNWSQRDDFHGREYNEALKQMKDKSIRIEDVLRVIDDDIHKRPATGPNDPDLRAAHAVPCKPRPFYD